MVVRLPTVIKRAIMIFVTALIAVCMFSTTAYADDTGTSEIQQYITVGDDTGFTAILKGNLNNMINDMNGNRGFNSTVEDNAIMSPGSTLRNVWIQNESTIEAFYNVFFSLGMGMSIAYFLIYLQRELVEGRWNTDALIKASITLIAACWIMAHGYDIMCSLIEIGSALGTQIQNIANAANAPVSGVGQDFIDGINNTSGKIWIILALILGNIQLFLPWLVTNCMYLYVQVVVYMRIIELVMRTMGAPLALGDIYSGGPNPTAIRYLRSYLACALKGVVIIGCLYAYRIVSSGVASVDGALGIFGNIVIIAATVGFIGKSSSFANELCGVG